MIRNNTKVDGRLTAAKKKRRCRVCNDLVRHNMKYGICGRRPACRKAVLHETRRRELHIGELRVKTVCVEDDRHDVSIFTGNRFEVVCSISTPKVADEVVVRLRAAIRDAILCDRSLNRNRPQH